MSDLNDAELDAELTNLPEDVDDDDEEVAFLPFLALNEFMRDDYRMQVVRTALTALPNLPEPIRLPIERLTRQVVKVPGFRNSEKAPLLKRLRPTASAFEKSSAMVVAILAAWAEATPELRQLVYDLLLEIGWDVLPIEADRTQLPGFLTRWPKGQSFETINAAFAARYPESSAGSDDVSLMVVWLLVRLPYDMVDDEDEESGEEDQPALD